MSLFPKKVEYPFKGLVPVEHTQCSNAKASSHLSVRGEEMVWAKNAVLLQK